MITPEYTFLAKEDNREKTSTLAGILALAGCTVGTSPDYKVLIAPQFRCESMSNATKQKILDQWDYAYLTTEDIYGAQVKIGPGLDPFHDWWIVAYSIPNSEGKHYGASYNITDAPGYDENTTWIDVGLVDGELDQPSLAWTGDLRDKGASALDHLTTCPLK